MFYWYLAAVIVVSNSSDSWDSSACPADFWQLSTVRWQQKAYNYCSCTKYINVYPAYLSRPRCTKPQSVMPSAVVRNFTALVPPHVVLHFVCPWHMQNATNGLCGSLTCSCKWNRNGTVNNNLVFQLIFFHKVFPSMTSYYIGKMPVNIWFLHFQLEIVIWILHLHNRQTILWNNNYKKYAKFMKTI